MMKTFLDLVKGSKKPQMHDSWKQFIKQAVDLMKPMVRVMSEANKKRKATAILASRSKSTIMYPLNNANA